MLIKFLMPAFLKQLFINNEFVDSISKKKFATTNPANGKKLADISEGFKEDVNVAVEAAKKAFQRGSVWRKMSATARAQLMFK